MNKYLLNLLIIGSLFFLTIPKTSAVEQLYTNADLGSQPDRNNLSGSVGADFTMGSEDRWVDSLGYYDKNNDGLATAHRVAIWDSGDNLIAQVTVQAGTASELSDNFRWEPIPGGPVKLLANTEYTIGGECFNGGDIWKNLLSGYHWPFNSYYDGDNEHYCTWNNTGIWGPPNSGGSALAWTYGYMYGAANMRTVGEYSGFWLYWNLDETSGTTASDSSGSNHPGTLYDGLTFDNDSVPGKDSTALLFNGTTDYAEYSFSPFPWGSYSISFWVKASVVGQYQYSAPLNTYSSSAGGFQIDVTGGSPGSYRYISNSGSINIGTVTTDWVHLAVTYDGSDTKVYYNGAYADSDTFNDSTFSRICLGTNRANTVFFDGAIDDVQVYQSALNDAQIQYLYQNPGEFITDSPTVYDPDPAQGNWDVPVDANLSWHVTGVDGFTPKFDVYLGTDPNALVLVADNQTPQLYDPVLDLSGGTSYYWKVDVVDDSGSPDINYPGDLWSFVTYKPMFAILEWKLDGDYIQTTEYYTDDTSGFNYDGLLVNPPAAGPNWVPGLDGNSLELAGDDDYVIYEDAEYLAIEDTDSWALNLYVQLYQESTEWTRLASLGEGFKHVLYLLEDNRLGFVYDGQYILLPDISLYPGQWYMVSVVKSDSTIKMYIDGIEEVSKSLPLGTADEIGSYANLQYYVNSATFKGLIDEFTVYRSILTPTEIQTLAGVLPYLGDVDINNEVGYGDLDDISQDWLSQKGQVISDNTLDDFESYTSGTLAENWYGRKDLPGDNNALLLTSGAHSGSQAVQWVYDFNEGRLIGIDCNLPNPGVDVSKYDYMHVWLYKESVSTGGSLWCKFINEDWPMTGDLEDLAQGEYPGGIDALPSDQWTQWVIDLDELKSKYSYSSDYNIPSNRLTNVVRLYFGGYDNDGGSGTIRIDDIKLVRDIPICTNSQQVNTDINGDCKVDLIDYSLFALDWLKSK